MYNFLAFENERLGIPLGSKFKKWPVKVKNIYQYKYEDGQLLFRAFRSEGSVTSELFYIYQPGRTIQVTYGGDGTGTAIKGVAIIWFDQSLRQTAYQKYANPMQGETIINGEVTYPDPDHIFIKETGKIGNIKVDKDIEVITAPAIEIYSTSYTLASGIIKRIRIFPSR